MVAKYETKRRPLSRFGAACSFHPRDHATTRPPVATQTPGTSTTDQAERQGGRGGAGAWRSRLSRLNYPQITQMGADQDVPHFRFSGPPADFFHLAAMVSFLLLAEAPQCDRLWSFFAPLATLRETGFSLWAAQRCSCSRRDAEPAEEPLSLSGRDRQSERRGVGKRLTPQ